MASKLKVLFVAVMVVMGLAEIKPAAASMIVETFNNMPFNRVFMNRIDPDTGITFKNPQSRAGNGFTVQQPFALADLPNLPAKMLIAETTLAGTPFSPDFGFTMSFPEPISLLTMDMVSAPTGTEGGNLLLIGYDSSGNILAEQTTTFGNIFTDFETDLSFSTTGTGFSSVQVYTETIEDGFANISFEPATVPEPVFLSLFMLPTVILLRRDRRN
jgi:hypothetical protein